MPSSPSRRIHPREGDGESLRGEIVSCTRCPRLVRFRKEVPVRASYRGQDYWRRPVPGFGDINGRLLVLGLAPAAHGGNRTGRIFTGDSSGRFFVKSLYETGFASQPVSESADDGLVYHDCYLTAVVKCVPPGDKPTGDEFANCSRFLRAEMNLMPRLEAILALGAVAVRACIRQLGPGQFDSGSLTFRHGGVLRSREGLTVYSSYHPSPRNTNTGKLSQTMLTDVLRRILSDLN